MAHLLGATIKPSNYNVHLLTHHCLPNVRIIPLAHLLYYWHSCTTDSLQWHSYCSTDMLVKATDSPAAPTVLLTYIRQDNHAYSTGHTPTVLLTNLHCRHLFWTSNFLADLHVISNKVFAYNVIYMFGNVGAWRYLEMIDKRSSSSILR